ncbi:MAG: hypothetical protein IPJ34_30950 [Myxococcales bacterium]|nr:hypothetical protein [Myxococcales bacterium]
MKPSRLSLVLLLVASSAVGCVIGPKPEDPAPSLTADTGTDAGLDYDGSDLSDATTDSKAADTSTDATPPPADGADDAKGEDGATDAGDAADATDAADAADAADASPDSPAEGG